ncbi:MAG: amidohydrolase [Bacillota bacterium]
MLLLKNISYLISDARTTLRNADLLIDGARIAAVGAIDPAALPAHADVLDFSGKAVLPGFVNAHTHLWQMYLKGRRDDLPLSGWCDEVLLPFLGAAYAVKREPGAQRLSFLWAALAMCDMLHSGVTAFADMDLEFHQDGIFEAARLIGLRGAIGVEMADRFYSDSAETLESSKAEVLRLIKKWPRTPDAPVFALIAPSEPNLCTDGLLRWLAEQAKAHSLPVQAHICETLRESEQVLSERGMRALEWMDEFGFLSPAFSAVHGVHLSPEEIALAAKRGVTVVYNPKSNMKLASGVAPIVELLKAGVNVALATDGPASNDAMDLFEEMRLGAMLQKVDRRDPAALCAPEIFSIATLGGARMLGIDAGELKPGKLADLAAVDLGAAHLLAFGEEILPALVYCARSGDVSDVIVGGRLVLHDKKVLALDERALLKEARDAGLRFIGRAGAK